MRFIQPSFEIMQCPDGEEVLTFLERAARTCYKSEDKIDEGQRGDECCPGKRWAREPSSHRLIRKLIKTDFREQLLRQIVDTLNAAPADGTELERALLDLVIGTVHQSITGRHESVIEHAVVSVGIVCNRGVSHELVRHRLASYSQESTRYCNYSRGKFGGGLNIIEPSHRPPESQCPAKTHTLLGAQPRDPRCICMRRIVWEQGLNTIEQVYLRLLELGEKPQEARDILPIGLKTEVVSTFNLRQWRYVFIMRGLNEAAHPQIRELMLPLLHHLSSRIPIVFDDLVAESERRLDAMDVLPLWRSTMETQ